jgi:hypothetical protein
VAASGAARHRATGRSATATDSRSLVCPARSGRFELRHDRLPEHETAAEDEREAFDETAGTDADSV